MYMQIRDNARQNSPLSVNRAAQLLDVSRNGYYQWLANVDAADAADGMGLKDEIKEITLEYPRYGYRRVAAELKRRGHAANRKRVLSMMREDGLLCTRKKFKPVTTNSEHGLRRYPNLIKDMAITRLNQVWASDITYIRLDNGFAYLSVMLDLFSRKCIGWDMGRGLDAGLALNALDMAIETRWNCDITGLIHHSDQGIQYASRQYVDCLAGHDIAISMSRRGNPYDNAYVESFIKTLKYEEVYIKEYETFSDARDNIGAFIEKVYNKKRLHSSLGYRPPAEFCAM